MTQSGLVHEKQVLQNENTELKNKFLQAQSISQSAQQNIQALIVEKNQLLQRLHNMKIALEEKENELQYMKNCSRTTSDAQQLESQLREECEMKMRLHKELQENEKFREKYNELRRELAIVRNDYEQKLANQEKIADVTTIEAEDRIRSLEQMVSDLESRLDDRTYVKTIKILQGEKMMLEHRLRALMEELETQRDGGEKKSVALIDVERKYSSRIMDMEAQLKALQLESVRLREKVSSTEEEKHTLHLEVDRMHAEKIKFEGDACQLRQQIEEIMHSFKQEKGAIRQHAKEREMAWESEKSTLEQRAHDLQKRVLDMEAVHAELLRQKEDVERVAKVKYNNMRDEMDSGARILEREKGDLLLEREAAERSNERTTSHLRKQIESLRKDVNHLRSERDDELSQRHLLEAKCDNLEQQANWTITERDESIRAMEEARERLEECKQELQTALAFRSENDHLRLQLEFLQKDNRDLEAEREDLKEEFAKRLARLQRTYVKEKHMMMEKTTAYKEEYKKMHAEKEKKKAKFVKKIVNSEKRAQDQELLVKEKEKEIRQLKRQLAVFCNQQQDDMLGVLEQPGAQLGGPIGGSTRLMVDAGPFLHTNLHQPENSSIDCLFGPLGDPLFDGLI